MLTNNKTTVEPAIKSGGLEEKSVEAAVETRKHFVEPEISVPVDVLEATTFFQVATSGSTT